MRIFTYKPKPSQVDALGTVERLLRDAVIDRRYETHGLDRQVLEGIRNVPIRGRNSARSRARSGRKGRASGWLA